MPLACGGPDAVWNLQWQTVAEARAGQLQRRFGQHQERAGHHQIVALDKADEGKDTDYQNVVAAERDAVELSPENVTGG